MSFSSKFWAMPVQLFSRGLWRLQDTADRPRRSCLVGAIFNATDAIISTRWKLDVPAAARGRGRDFSRFRRTAARNPRGLFSHEKPRRNRHRRHVRAHRGANTAHGMGVAWRVYDPAFEPRAKPRLQMRTGVAFEIFPGRLALSECDSPRENS